MMQSSGIDFSKAIALFVLSFCSMTAFAQTAGPYTPDQVYSVMYSSIREALGFSAPIDKASQTWVSLSVVGQPVVGDDDISVNNLMDFCPPASPLLNTFGTEPKLDQIYEKLINYAVPPVRTYSADYNKARAYLFSPDGTNSKALDAYNAKKDAWQTQFEKFGAAKTQAARNQAFAAMQKADLEWQGAGHKYEIDNALNVTTSEEFQAGPVRQARRRGALEYAMTAAKIAAGGSPYDYVAPRSTFSPAPSAWDSSPGWVKISFAADSNFSQYSASNSSSSGFGGLSLGFVSFVGAGGGSGGTEHRFTQVNSFALEFELLRVHINRGWIDTSLLFEPQNWTWKVSPATNKFPYVAVSKDSSTGLPVQSSNSKYENQEVGCALYPVDAIVARKRKVTATMNTTDYASMNSSGSQQGGGSFFGIFGGAAKKSWSATNVTQSGNSTTFTVEAPGASVIGFVSLIVPQSPNPNQQDKWPTNAWLPK